MRPSWQSCRKNAAQPSSGPWISRPGESGDAISDVYMAIEPGKFAVKSYKHLLAMTDPSPFIQILLNAKWFYVYVP